MYIHSLYRLRVKFREWEIHIWTTDQVIVEQGATMGIPGSGNSRELSGIPGSDFSLPGSETWENRQNPPVTVDAADAFCTMGRIWPSICPRRMSYGPKLP